MPALRVQNRTYNQVIMTDPDSPKVLCTTVNLTLRRDPPPRAVMGAGNAAAIRNLWLRLTGTDLEIRLGSEILDHAAAYRGSIIDRLPPAHATTNPGVGGCVTVYAFPTKIKYWEPSPPSLIRESFQTLFDQIERDPSPTYYLPLPGANLGKIHPSVSLAIAEEEIKKRPGGLVGRLVMLKPY